MPESVYEHMYILVALNFTTSALKSLDIMGATITSVLSNYLIYYIVSTSQNF